MYLQSPNDPENNECARIMGLIRYPRHYLQLDLRGSNAILDVSALGNVHSLNLSGCHGISNVSALGNVHSLNLSGCESISDVSALGNVHSLNLP